MKRVLIISYYWPPTGGSGVQRWVKFSKYLPEFGWQPVIYTPSNPERLAIDESLSRDIPKEVEIVTSPILEPYDLYRKFTGKKKGKGSDINPINNTGKKSLSEKISLWARANLFIPDPRITWLKPSIKFLESYLKEHPVDAIVSTGPPQSMHLLAKELHRKTGIRWIADFRDPWTGIFYFKHLPMLNIVRKKHFSMEKSVVTEADKVVLVSKRVFNKFQEAYPEANLEYIPNGYDEDDFDLEASSLDKEFSIVHTGLFSKEGNPEKLWSALASLIKEYPGFSENLKIKLVGKTDKEIIESLEKYGLSEYVQNLGYIPHSELGAIQTSARLLILPLRREPEYTATLPGKFFEYMAASRPIIGIGPLECELSSMFDQTKCGKMFEWDKEAPIKEEILGLFKKYQDDDKSPSNCVNKEKYSRRVLTNDMVNLLTKANDEN